MKVFSVRDYREFIRQQIERNRATRGYQGLLAGAAGCQRSFLSQVLHTHVHLTPDQAANLCRYWALDDDETEYFLALVQLARAASPHLKSVLNRRLTALRQRHDDLSQRFARAATLVGNAELQYYSAWHLSAIHVLLGIPGFRTARAVSERLGLSPALVRASLAMLEELKLVERAGESWKVTKNHVHLPKHSPLVGVHHSNWRQKAILQLQGRDPAELHYTGVHSLSARDAERIKELLLDAIERSGKIIAPSPEEELVCVCLDYFRV